MRSLEVIGAGEAGGSVDDVTVLLPPLGTFVARIS
jgi:hypothetical protein